jgi:hypothetical protein
MPSPAGPRPACARLPSAVAEIECDGPIKFLAVRAWAASPSFVARASRRNCACFGSVFSSSVMSWTSELSYAPGASACVGWLFCSDLQRHYARHGFSRGCSASTTGRWCPLLSAGGPGGSSSTGTPTTSGSCLQPRPVPETRPSGRHSCTTSSRDARPSPRSRVDSEKSILSPPTATNPAETVNRRATIVSRMPEP